MEHLRGGVRRVFRDRDRQEGRGARDPGESQDRCFEIGAVSPPDLLAVAVAIDPSIAKIEDFYVFVETSGEYSRGMTIVDNRRYGRVSEVPGRKKISVALSVDQPRYGKLVLDTWLRG